MKIGHSMDMIEFSEVKSDVWKSWFTIVKSKKGFETKQTFCPFIVST